MLSADDPLLKGSRLAGGSGGELTASLKGPVHRYEVDLRVDAHGIAFADQPDGSHAAKVEYMLVAYDGEGKRVNYLDVGLLLKPNAQQLAQAMAAGLPVRMEIDLPEGQLWLRIAVHDLSAGRAGSMEVPLRVAAR